jgi:hypothetical protein
LYLFILSKFTPLIKNAFTRFDVRASDME